METPLAWFPCDRYTDIYHGDATCMETPLAWFPCDRCSLDAALPVVENLQKYRYILENIDGIFIDFS
jgi:hypothetical protein